MSINWYPGHMKKTRDLIEANLKLVDIVVELLDARIPISSKNPQFENLIGGKKRVVALNKHDLSDPVVTRKWVTYYKEKGIDAIPINSLNGQGISELLGHVKLASAEVAEKMKRQGRKLRPIRLMIIGIPNVGKSSLINRLAGKNAAKAGNKPGVTKGKQWIRINKDLELFDTPGILWPKIEEDMMGIKLACSGAIKDEILNIEDIAFHLIRILSDKYPEAIKHRYQLEQVEDPVEIMEAIGRKRGCLVKGNQVDLEKASRLIVDEFRKGIIGTISLESPEDSGKGLEE
ncbi:ribosome biogenesis GTPase YlqF [Fusibacter tunisiensis]|uniref:Ribosome biogenesis GTPase A n=1 Tax=Fusibacter tunisiensis TaxID=1008308 RepID=A0ABS2MMF3_9FIRM|nr:ribosome biogenesis GTPase A [Fusibacter tunisiensis]